MVTVLKGSMVNPTSNYDKMPKRIVELRNNRKIVDENGCVLKNVTFKSPTAAANFVIGRSTNGWVAWRVEDKVSLKNYFHENSKG